MEAKTKVGMQEVTRLLKEGDRPGALALVTKAFADGSSNPNILRMLLQLQVTGNHLDALLGTLREALTRQMMTRDQQRHLLLTLTWGKLEDTQAVLKQAFGSAPDSIEACLALVSHPLIAQAEAGALMQVVETLTGKPIPDRAAWMARQDEGYKRSIFYSILKQRQGADPTNPLQTLPPVTSSQADVVTGPLAQGRNLVLLQLHGLAVEPLQPLMGWLTETGVARSIIGNGIPPAATLPDFNLDTKALDLAIQFAKLCKLMKTAPRLVHLFPDGRRGTSFATMDIAGLPLDVGLGGARLAYYGKASLAFAHSRWVGAGIEIDYWPGPEVRPDQSPEEVETLFTAFYRDCLVRTLTDDPVNFGMLGGYWMKHLPPAPPRADRLDRPSLSQHLLREQDCADAGGQALSGPDRSLIDMTPETVATPQDQEALQGTNPKRERQRALLATRAEGRAAFLAALTAAKAKSPLTGHEQRALLRGLQGQDFPVDLELIEAILGLRPTTLDEAMAALSVPIVPPQQVQRVMQVVTEATGLAISKPKQFRERLELGERQVFFSRLLKSLKLNAGKPRQRRVAPDWSAVRQPLDAGRNVVLMSFHGNRINLTGPFTDYLTERAIPVSQVANHVRSNAKGEGLHVEVTAPDFVLQFAKLAKALKSRAPQVVSILPDGRQGGSFREISIAGQDFPIGMGAATLAYFGRATFVFARPVLRDHGFELDYIAGPSVGPEHSKEDAETLLTDFCRSILLDTLRGDPANFGLAGIFWRNILRESKE